MGDHPSSIASASTLTEVVQDPIVNHIFDPSPLAIDAPFVGCWVVAIVKHRNALTIAVDPAV